jgi:hypothetical protein
MALRLDIQLDGRNLRRLRLLESASRQSAAKALTYVAGDSVEPWRAGHRVFTRRNSWIDRGVRYRPATVRNMVAQVGTVDRYMGRHVVGIGQGKESTGRALFVPGEPAPQQGTHTQTRRKLKGYARTKRKPFIIRKGGRVLLARRTGKGHAFRILGSFRKSVAIPERLDAQGIVAGVVNAKFPRIYERLLLKWAESKR